MSINLIQRAIRNSNKNPLSINNNNIDTSGQWQEAILPSTVTQEEFFKAII